MKRKLFIMILIAVIVIVFTPTIAMAANQTITTVDSPFDLSTTIAGSNQTLIVAANSNIVLFGTLKPGVRLLIKNGAIVTLQDATVDLSTYNKRYGIRIEPAVAGDTVTINLIGTSVVKGGPKKAGIRVNSGASLIINGPGELNVTGGSAGAGIGSHNSKNAGNITINGGVITATGGNNGAGIGGGINGGGGVVTIIGGEVYAQGNGDAQDIGNGTSGSGGTLALSGSADVFVENQAAGSVAPNPTLPYRDLNSNPPGYNVPAGWTYPIGFYGTLNATANPQTGKSINYTLLYILVGLFVAAGSFTVLKKTVFDKN